jgi:hypothetical protein
MRILGIVLVVLGILAVAAGVIYLAVAADKLPSFVPGHSASATFHHTKRGIAGLVVGAILLIAGGLIAARGRRGRVSGGAVGSFQ